MVQRVHAKIVSSSALNETIWRYVLKPDQFIAYQAGQYLQIHSSESENFYSIANAPNPEQTYELHVRQRSSPVWLQHLELSVSLPYGSCDVAHLIADKPILFVAVGTGFAPIRAMIDQLINQSDPRHIALHWGVAVAADLYDHDSLQRWQEQRPSFQSYAYVSPVHQLALVSQVLEHQPDLKNWQIVMAGPFDLMYAMQKEWLQYGLDKHAIFSDAFEWIPQTGD